MPLNRRSFIKTTALAGSALALPAISYGRILGSNDKIGCCVIGLNSRGQEHMDQFGDNVVALCDCDENILGKRSQDRNVATFGDYRDVMDDKRIDAVSIATPNHLHSLIGITAAMAGKHVYCEKPVSHNVWEGRQLAAAANRYKVIIQCGTQARSSAAYREAHQFASEGNLGAVRYAVGTCFKPRKSIGKLDRPLEIPKSVDYELWCGPAEKRELYRPKLHYDWHWDFNTGNGDMGNQGIHQMDIARWFLGYDTISPRVLSIGGRLGYEDAGDTPNTQTVIHDYPGAPLIFETRGLPRSKEFQNEGWAENMDRYRGSGIGVIVQYENGNLLLTSDYGRTVAFDNDGNKIKDWQGGGNHFANFLDAVQTNDASKLNGPIVEGHLSSALCHTGGVSHQLGRKASLAEIETAIENDNEFFKASLDRMVAHLEANGVDVRNQKTLTLGLDIKLDPETEQVIGNEVANSRMTREYRKGFEVPEVGVKVAS
jgi:predicted dehydrogenase